MAESWLTRRTTPAEKLPDMRRALAAAWLDEVRDALKSDHRRWRHARVEGLGPVDKNIAIHASRAADSAFEIIEKALRPILGGNPIPPVGIVVMATLEDYLSFIAAYYPDEGEFATSGGMYLNGGTDAFPFVALPAPSAASVAGVIAHELTHHALFGMGLPLWVEEGLTQMMAERVTGIPNFVLNEELLGRHRHRWQESGLDGFWSGASFHSPHEDEQELAYHLSQILVRGQLDRDAAAFFRFARACRESGPEAAVRDHFGTDPDDVVERFLGPRGA